jgi:hypothetical protein
MRTCRENSTGNIFMSNQHFFSRLLFQSGAPEWPVGSAVCRRKLFSKDMRSSYKIRRRCKRTTLTASITSSGQARLRRRRQLRRHWRCSCSHPAGLPISKNHLGAVLPLRRIFLCATNNSNRLVADGSGKYAATAAMIFAYAQSVLGVRGNACKVFR